MPKKLKLKLKLQLHKHRAKKKKELDKSTVSILELVQEKVVYAKKA
jgi:hypothetical protein